MRKLAPRAQGRIKASDHTVHTYIREACFDSAPYEEVD